MPVRTLSEGATLRRIAGPVCIGLGLLLILASFGGAWGPAYGQTVPTPTPHIRVADPQISKTSVPSCCSPGDKVTFNIVVTNVGDATATNVVISDTIPPQLSIVAITTTWGVVTVTGNHFTVAIGMIAPGQIVTIVIQTIVLIAAPIDIVITNLAQLTSDQGTRQASTDVLIKKAGACATPPIFPPTGAPVEPEGGTSPWLLLAGLLLLLLGIVLTARARRSSSPGES